MGHFRKGLEDKGVPSSVPGARCEISDALIQRPVRARSLLWGLMLACTGAGPDAGAPDGAPDAEVSDLGPLDLGGRDLGVPDSGPAGVRFSDPEDGAESVPRSAWLFLELDRSLGGQALESVGLECGGRPLEIRARPFAGRIIVDPVGLMPAASDCVLRALGAEVGFSTAPDRAAPSVRYDRGADGPMSPFPDAFFMSQGQVRLPEDLGLPFDLESLLRAYILAASAGAPDGFSPLGPIVVELDDAVLQDSLPNGAMESVSPLSSVILLELDPGRSDRLSRIPIEIFARTDGRVDDPSHNLIIFPARPLSPQREYGVVLTRRVLSSEGRAFGPSAFLERVLEAPDKGEPMAVTQVRDTIAPVLQKARALRLPIEPEDIALALRFRTRSVDRFVDDPLAMRAQARETPTGVIIDAVEPTPSARITALVRGRWTAPVWGQGPFIQRDQAGVPVLTGTTEIPFILSIPDRPRAPVVMYQHGQPGSAEQTIPSVALDFAEDGFATIGFTDAINRRFPIAPDADAEARAQWVLQLASDNVQVALGSGRHPDYPLRTLAEQLAFIRFIATLDRLDVAPAGSPDGAPDLDPQKLLYVGQSKGSINGTALLPFAPEIRAAVLQVGGGNQAAINIHQAATELVSQVQGAIPSARATDIWLALALEQMALDPQEPQNLARFLYRDAVMVGGSLQKPSVLVLEGLNDTLVPVVSTRGGAFAFGPLLHLSPSVELPFLAPDKGPIQANIDADTTAAFYQYVPVGVREASPTPGCEIIEEREGHFCPARSAEGRRQRSVFLRSALNGAPTVIDPLQE